MIATFRISICVKGFKKIVALSDLVTYRLIISLRSSAVQTEEWTRRELNPLLFHAMEACYRYTTSP